MENEGAFRLALTIGIVTLMLVGGSYRVRSNASGASLDRRQEGWFILIGLRLIASLALLTILTFLIAPQQLDWCAIGLPAGLRWAGFAFAKAFCE